MAIGQEQLRCQQELPPSSPRQLVARNIAALDLHRPQTRYYTTDIPPVKCARGRCRYVGLVRYANQQLLKGECEPHHRLINSPPTPAGRGPCSPRPFFDTSRVCGIQEPPQSVTVSTATPVPAPRGVSTPGPLSHSCRWPFGPLDGVRIPNRVQRRCVQVDRILGLSAPSRRCEFSSMGGTDDGPMPGPLGRVSPGRPAGYPWMGNCRRRRSLKPAHGFDLITAGAYITDTEPESSHR